LLRGTENKKRNKT